MGFLRKINQGQAFMPVDILNEKLLYLLREQRFSYMITMRFQVFRFIICNPIAVKPESGGVESWLGLRTRMIILHRAFLRGGVYLFLRRLRLLIGRRCSFRGGV